MDAAVNFDVYAVIASKSEPVAFWNLSRTCKRFYEWRNNSHILQQFNHIHIDKHLKDGHLALLKYKHEKGLKCSYLSSARAITIALEREYLRTLEYLFSLGKVIEGAYVVQLAARRKEPYILKLIAHHVQDQKALLRAAVNQGNAALAAQFTAQQLITVLITISINAEHVISKCVADRSDWDYFLEMLILNREYGPRSVFNFNNPVNERHLLDALLRKYPMYRTRVRLEAVCETEFTHHYPQDTAVQTKPVWLKRVRSWLGIKITR